MPKPSATTPLMEQYLSIKAKHKDAVLFFRMGDFYEMFYNDAKTGAEVLGITLTSRAHGKSADVPLAGFPHHALDTYLAKMIKAGYRVAICEQVEDPKLAKTIVKREVLEVVTPGTAVTDELLETKRNNYLVSIYIDQKSVGLAKIDVSTGEFHVTEIKHDEISEQIESIQPAEMLIPANQLEEISGQLKNRDHITITKRDDWTFGYDYAHEILTGHFSTLSLKGFGVEDLRAGISAAGAILVYLQENQKEKLAHINKLSRFSDNDYMVIDSTSKRNLELFKSMNAGSRKGTLIDTIDKTRTPMGGRMLVQWLEHPLLEIATIEERYDGVEELTRHPDKRKKLADVLDGAGDLERSVARFACGRANARDAGLVLATLKVVDEIKKMSDGHSAHLTQELMSGLDACPTLADEIERAIVDTPPLSLTDGGIIKRGYDAELDKLRQIVYSGKDWIARLQKKEREATGIPSLKVNFNKVFGYYIEVTKPHIAKVPSHYHRKQTLVNAERFITQELKEYEEQVLGAEEKMASLEYELFEKIRQNVLSHTEALQKNAHHLAQLDCLASLATVAFEKDYNRPEMHDGDEIIIRDGRHPVIETLLPPGEQFVANDIRMNNNEQQIIILTGPNMAGKSTYLRQIGHIVILAHMGSFVPAKSARICIVDRVFTRVGASDNLAAGESTFLTEMNETANILNNATPKSLILLDEIGRGTSTFDGLSIAWSVAEYLHNTPTIAAKTIFATHYHEMTELELVLSRVKNYNVAVKEWGDHIVFLRKIVEGGCDHSYGIQVAKLAGLPRRVIDRAKEILVNLEKEALNSADVPKLAQHHEKKETKPSQLDLFAELEQSLRKQLSEIDPNKITPIQALAKLDELKQLAHHLDK
jgi:DNA mismatch repair protein MutS